jgi:hypothetical protein
MWHNRFLLLELKSMCVHYPYGHTFTCKFFKKRNPELRSLGQKKTELSKSKESHSMMMCSQLDE